MAGDCRTIDCEYTTHKRLCSVALLCMVTGSILYSMSVRAELQWNYFGTLGLGVVNDESVVANTNLAYSGFTEDVSGEELTRLGIQPSYRFNEELSITLQAVSRQAKDFDPEIEWGYLNYNISDNASVRAGLIRRPLFQYTDSLFVGYGSRWVQPPSSAYLDIEELYGNIRAVNFLYNGVVDDWLYTTELYLGRGSGEGMFAGQQTSNNARQNLGLVLNVERDNYALRLGFHRSNFSLSIDGIDQLGQSLRQFGLDELADDVLLENEKVYFYSIGGSYLSNDWEVFGERVTVDIQDTYIPKIDAWYLGVQRSLGNFAVNVTIGGQVTDPKLTPGEDILAVAQQTPDPLVAGALTQAGQQLSSIVQMSNAKRFSKSVGIRYDFSSAFALKSEIERVTDKELDESANMVSVSLDFVY